MSHLREVWLSALTKDKGASLALEPHRAERTGLDRMNRVPG